MKLIQNIFDDSSALPRSLSFSMLSQYGCELCACLNFVDDKHVNILYVVSLSDGKDAFYTVTEYRVFVSDNSLLGHWRLTKVEYLNELSGQPKSFIFHD